MKKKALPPHDTGRAPIVTQQATWEGAVFKPASQSQPTGLNTRDRTKSDSRGTEDSFKRFTFFSQAKKM